MNLQKINGRWEGRTKEGMGERAGEEKRGEKEGKGEGGGEERRLLLPWFTLTGW